LCQVRCDLSTPDVRSEHIAVAVTDGAVTLAGEATDVAEKQAALRAASEVAGVVAVVDEIEICGAAAGLNEADIARAATDAIEASSTLRHQSVSATVHDRVVSLAGVVEEADQRDTAERVAYAVPGVRAVVNDLRVLPPAGTDETKQRIAEALMHAVESEIDHLAIEVDDHTATLNGSSTPGTSGAPPNRRPAPSRVSPPSTTSSSSATDHVRDLAAPWAWALGYLRNVLTFDQPGHRAGHPPHPAADLRRDRDEGRTTHRRGRRRQRAARHGCGGS
jgi:Predicted periplasmic or secreted lipoprotein